MFTGPIVNGRFGFGIGCMIDTQTHRDTLLETTSSYYGAPPRNPEVVTGARAQERAPDHAKPKKCGRQV